MYTGVRLRGAGTVLSYTYFPMRNEKILKLYNEFLWNDHNDLCRHSQFLANEHNRQLDRIKKFNEEHVKLDELISKEEKYIKDNIETLTVKEKEDYQDKIQQIEIMQSRIRETIFNANDELNSSIGFMRKSFIVTLWSIVEQFCSKCLDLAETELTEPAKNRSNSHIWDILESRFEAIGINLRSIIGYEDINECRVVNNKIKHVGYVDSALVKKYPSFTSYLNKNFRLVDLDLQRYSDSVYDFLVNLMGILENKLEDKIV
ncbi:hypothetical protein [Clostridium perfringens]|uniref:hypothetical protein n=1 Tax=Clostridium perfringens TaxID=1502 RepID=UPI0039E945EB